MIFFSDTGADHIPVGIKYLEDIAGNTDKDCLITYLKIENERLRAEKAEYWETLKREYEKSDVIPAALPDLTKDRKKSTGYSFGKSNLR